MTKQESVRVYLFPEEKAHVEAMANEKDRSLAAYIRLLVVADMKAIAKKTAITSESADDGGASAE